MPSIEIQKRVNTKRMVASVLCLLAGVALALLSAPYPSTSWGMFGITCGGLVAAVALAFICFRSRHWVFMPTRSPLRLVSRSLPVGSLPECCEELSRISRQFQAIPHFADKSDVRLDYIYSEDGQFAAVQLCQYSTLLYVPLMEICYLRGPKAQAFLQWLKERKF